MSDRTDADLLDDIREAARRIHAYLDDLSSEQFAADLKTQDAVIRNLEIIGEARRTSRTSCVPSTPRSPGKTSPG